MLFGKTIVITGVSSGIGARSANSPQHGRRRHRRRYASARRAARPPSSRRHSARRRRRPRCAPIAPAHRRADAMSPAFPASRARRKRWRSISMDCARSSRRSPPQIREGGAVVNVASIAGYGWRANLERAKAMIAPHGFPESRLARGKHGVADAEGYPLSKEPLLLWTQRAAHQPLFKIRGVRVNAVSPGPVTTPILKEFRTVFGDPRVDDDISRASGARARRPTSRRPCCSSAPTARAG